MPAVLLAGEPGRWHVHEAVERAALLAALTQRLLTHAVVVAFAALAAPALAQTQLRTQNFSSDPGWDAFANRQVQTCPTTQQSFGYNPPPNHLGYSLRGDVGGIVDRTYRFAHFSKDIGSKTLNDFLRVSGHFRIQQMTGDTTVYFGFYNRNSADWRKPHSIMMRLDGNGNTAQLFLEYATRSRLAGGANDPANDDSGPVRVGPIVPGQNYDWRITYSPTGGIGYGQATLEVSGRPLLTANLTQEQRLDGALFDRVGLMNHTRTGDAMEIYFDDIAINDQLEPMSGSTLPGWGGANNQSTYQDCLIPKLHDFGWVPSPGTAGGIMWRTRNNPAWYADRIGAANQSGSRTPLTLQHELYASGTMAFTRAPTDGGVFLGFFNSGGAFGRCGDDDPGGQSAGLPEDFLGITTGGVSVFGERAWPVFRTRDGKRGSYPVDSQTTPLVLSDKNARGFELRYTPTLDPDGIARSGIITFTYNGRTVQLSLPSNAFDTRTTFNRFGLRAADCDGSYYEPYLDNLTYTAAVP